MKCLPPTAPKMRCELDVIYSDKENLKLLTQENEILKMKIKRLEEENEELQTIINEIALNGN
jgi:hypothetical protein